VLGLGQGVVAGIFGDPPHGDRHLPQHVLRTRILGEVDQLVRVALQVVQLVAVEAVEDVLVLTPPDDALRVVQPLTMELGERLRLRQWWPTKDPLAEVAAVTAEVVTEKQFHQRAAEVEQAYRLLDYSAGFDTGATDQQWNFVDLLE